MDYSRLNTYKEIASLDFLKKKLDRELKLTEILLLDYIVDTYAFPDGVTNLFVEQVLKMNNNKLTRGFTLKMANKWVACNFRSLRSAVQFADKDYHKFTQLQNRDNFGEVRELTLREKEIVNRILYKSSLDSETLDLVISYCMKINDGYIISWFINRVVDFLEIHDMETGKATQQLINDFHQKYVLYFGLDKEIEV